MALAASAAAQQFSIRVIDGDTLQIDKQRYRLCGVDAPEIETPAGKQAKQFVIQQIQTRVVETGADRLWCLPVGQNTPCDGRSRKRSYNRVVAQCFIGDDDLAELLVRQGLAVDVPRYSGGYYGEG